MSAPPGSNPVDATSARRARSGWTAVAAAVVVLVIVALPLVYFALDEGSTARPGPDHKALVNTDNDSLAAVRAALGQTFAAGSYESDTVSESTIPAPTSCVVLRIPAPAAGQSVR